MIMILISLSVYSFAQTITTFSTPGSQVWTCPAGIDFIQVEVWGAGAGGGNSNNTTNNGGSGGGGGAFSRSLLAVTAGTTYTLFVGNGGDGAPLSSTTNATSGTDSWFSLNVGGTIPTSIAEGVLAEAGTRGFDDGGTVGAGGLAANGYGDVKYSGSVGVIGAATTGGSGGSSAGTHADGVNSIANNTLAYAPNGGGYGGEGETAAAPSNGANPGGGGGGSNDATAAAGGDGGNGKVIITEAVGNSATQQYFMPGAYTWTAPACITSVTVGAFGGGGGGGSSDNGTGSGGNGGGGGAYSESVLTVVPGVTYSIVIGEGGKAGIANSTASATAGGDTWFSSAGTLMAKGGGAGGNNSGAIGTGGAEGSGVGTITNSGGDGGAAAAGGTGGGSSAGTANGVDGNTAASSNGSAGGTAPAGGYAGGGGSNSNTTNGADGSNYGGGGGGSDDVVRIFGGNGGNGYLSIAYAPTVSLSSYALTGQSITATSNGDNIPLHCFELTVGVCGTTFTGFNFTSSGDYNASDIGEFDLYITNSNIFAITDSLSSVASPTAAGTQTYATFSKVLATGTYYVWVTTDLTRLALNGRTIQVSATASGDVTVTDNSIDGSATTSGFFTFGRERTYNSGATWTVPDCVTEIEIEVWGAGGGGGSSVDNTWSGCSGGAGGAYSKSILSVTPGDTYSIVIGAGGAFGSTNGGDSGDGVDGGDSWFENPLGTVLVMAKGGQAGLRDVVPSGSYVPGGVGQSGGQASAGIGQLKFDGGDGGDGWNGLYGQAGSGGSSAGVAAKGVEGNFAAYTSAASASVGPAYSGNGGIGGSGQTTGNKGGSGAVPGGGGGGGGGEGSGPDDEREGGVGGEGQVKISWSRTRTYNGSGTWTVPAGITSIDIEIWGAGGAGAGANNTLTNGQAGGGGGAYTKSTLFVTPGETYSVNVGAGGIGGDVNGTAGGASWFSLKADGSIPTLISEGALAEGGTGATYSNTGGVIGTKGLASGGIGDTKFDGGNGGAGNNGNTQAGGGGGSSGGSGTNGNDGTSSAASGAGGIAPTGGFAGGNGGWDDNESGANNNSLITFHGNPGDIGSGGGGASSGDDNNYSSSTYARGGDGSNGRILIDYSSEDAFIGDNPQAAAFACASTSDILIHSFLMTEIPMCDPALLSKITAIDFTTTGTYLASDVTNFKLYYHSSDDFSSATLLGTNSSPSAAGLQSVISFAGTPVTLISDQSIFFWITMDASATAGSNRTLIVSTTTAANITATEVPVFDGVASGTQTFIEVKLSSSSSPVDICSGSVFTYTATSTAASPTFAWTRAIHAGITEAATSTSGTGNISETLTNETATVINVTYNYVTTSSGCSGVSEEVVVQVDPAPSASVGGAQTICSNATATVSGASAANGTIAWTENGAGSITLGATTLTPTYTAAVGDAGNAVVLTMTVTSNNACNPATATATYTVNVDELPSASAGGSQTICSNTTATVSGASSANGTIAWTENGSGSITSGATTLTPVYTAAVGDEGNDVVLTITVTSNNACNPALATASYTVSVDALPTATAGGSQSICATGTATVSGASSSDGTIAWTENGSGSITSGGTTLTPVYTAAAGDAGNTVVLTLTVTSNNTCNPAAAVASYSVTVDALPSASAGGNQTICSNATATVSGASATNGTIAWTENGSGSITSGATTLTPVYTAAVGDAGNAVVLTMTVTSNNACNPQTATATYTVNVEALPTATAGGTQTICMNTTATVSGASSSDGTIVWTENGAGSITSGGTTLTPVYTAAVGDAGNAVVLTITVTSNNACNPALATASYTVNVDALPAASAGGSATICSNGTATINGASATNGTIVWTENGAGSITSGGTTLTPDYTAAAADEGNEVILTMTVTSNNTCNPAIATATYTVNVDGLPAATSGGSQTICSNGTATVSGASSSDGTIAWTENGAGSITSGATTLTPTYTAAVGDAGNSVVLTMTSTSNNACNPSLATATYTVIVEPLPTATAGGTATICSNATHSVGGASSSNGTIAWTENGVGSITANGTTLTPVYTAAAGDEGKTVVLTMTVTSNNSCNPAAAVASYSVVVEALPTASAGGSQTICSNVTATVSGASSTNGTIAWTDNGSGSITSGGTTLTPVYTASAGDEGNAVVLTMTVTSNNNCNPATAVATYTVNVDPLPIASAGGSTTICAIDSVTVSGASYNYGTIAWTENGAGSISSVANTLTPTYVAVAADAGNTIVLTMSVTSTNTCNPQIATATYSISIDPTPIATAGGSATICSNATHTVSGANATNGTIAWTENGVGSITSGATTLTPVYTAAAGDEGNAVTLTMTVTSNNSCGTQTVTATYTVNVDALPIATAGGSTITCVTNTATVSGASSNYGSITWTENGAGSITSGANTLTPTYTPQAGDTGNEVELTMTVTSTNTCIAAIATATYTINIDPLPIATAGGTAAICSNDSATVSGASSNYGSITWTENGVGSISTGVNTLTPTYVAVAGDEGNAVILTMTVTSTNTCSPAAAIASYTINVNELPVALAGGFDTICVNSSITVSGASASYGSILWTENGAGSITSGATTLSPVYEGADSDEGNTVTLTMTVTSTNSCGIQTAIATHAVYIDPLPIAIAGGNKRICSNGSGAVTGASASFGSILWTENGAGSITSGGLTLTPVYEGAIGDEGNTVVLTMTVTSNNTCNGETAITNFTINIDSLPTASAGGSETICSNGSHTVNGAIAVNGAILWTHNGTGNLTWDNTLTPTYTAALSDAGNAVTLTMTVTSYNNCAPQFATATYTVNVDESPLATSTGNAIICSNDSHTVSGVNATNGTILWTENGAGSITSGVNTLTPTYTAALGDAGNSVDLTMTVTSNNSCGSQSSTATYNINVNNLPTATIIGSPTTATCANTLAPQVIGASPQYGTPTWSHNGSGSLSGHTTLSPTYYASNADAGKDIILLMTVLSNNACIGETATATYTVNVYINATMGLISNFGTDNQQVCLGNAITPITYTVSPNVDSVQISPLPDGVTYSAVTANTFTISGSPIETGQFIYTINTFGLCGQTSRTGTITSGLTLLSSDTLANQTVCFKEPIVEIKYAVGKDVLIKGLPTGIVGNNDDAGVYTISGTPSEAGIFEYSLINIGCINTPTLTGTITVKGESITVSNPLLLFQDSICDGSAIVDIEITIAETANDPIIVGDNAEGLKLDPIGNNKWIVTGNAPDQSGIFTYSIVTTSKGCENYTESNSDIEFTLSAGAPEADFNLPFTKFSVPNDIAFTNTSLGEGNTYEWIFGDTLNPTYTSFNRHESNHYTETRGEDDPYIVTLKAAAYGCTDEISKTFSTYYIAIPNIFTPNGDGINDMFILNPDGILEITVEVFNRWGKKVAEWDENAAGWDGNSNGSGEECPAGTYFYIVNLVDAMGETQTITNSIYLTR